MKTETPITAAVLPLTDKAKPSRKLYRGEAYSDAKASDFIGNIFKNPEGEGFHIYPIHPDGGLLPRLPQVFNKDQFTRLADLRISASQSVVRFQLHDRG